jgi:hypothetical protein
VESEASARTAGRASARTIGEHGSVAEDGECTAPHRDRLPHASPADRAPRSLRSLRSLRVAVGLVLRQSKLRRALVRCAHENLARSPRPSARLRAPEHGDERMPATRGARTAARVVAPPACEGRGAQRRDRRERSEHRSRLGRYVACGRGAVQYIRRLRLQGRAHRPPKHTSSPLTAHRPPKHTSSPLTAHRPPKHTSSPLTAHRPPKHASSESGTGTPVEARPDTTTSRSEPPPLSPTRDCPSPWIDGRRPRSPDSRPPER